MSKPIQAINRYKADLRELRFLLFEQFKLGELLGKAPFEAWGEEECRPRSTECYRWVREVTGPLNAIGDVRAASSRTARSRAAGLQGGVEEAVRGRLEVVAVEPGVRRRRARPTRCSVLVEEMISRREHRVQHVPRPRVRRGRGHRVVRHRRAEAALLRAHVHGRVGRHDVPHRAAGRQRRGRGAHHARRRTPTAATASAARRSSSPAAITISPTTSSTWCSRACDGAPAGHQGAHAVHRAEAPRRRRRQARREQRRRVGAIEHKMGINGSATCVLNFGENGGCIGLAGRRRREAQPGHEPDVQDDERRAHRRRHPGHGGRVDGVPERARVRAGAQAGRVDQALEGRDRAARADHRARRRAPHAPRHEVAGRRHPRARHQARAATRTGARVLPARTKRASRTTRARSICSCRS